MTFEQILEIPADHRVTVELPASIPAGTARIKVSVSQDGKPVKMSRQMRNIMKFYGCLKDSPAFAGDPVALQHQMRSEWDNNG